ncbi:MAG: 4a-hydroxytetrahydrobiopterin dehydratase [Acidimicrobiaceae bacterium]|nr:4a-hydroxytetrahydrobiopterin dehydratase [Acidimicrobiaceae bacterium]MBD27226.1 4a-hydroxytetrahydrobiopterin dehydratase [Acidimicrobiaceae bacterium]CAI8392617.1 MAG: Putative pterin-4-alpha-carbinolamine dehydratase [Acidimicrobiaceae bacterium]
MQDRLLEKSELEEAISKFPKWEYQEESLKQDFIFSDFREAFEFMVQVAEIAETLNHHPDWSNSWNKVSIAISTHSAGGLTALDLKFVEKVESLSDS